jgi:hypothetical protein
MIDLEEKLGNPTYLLIRYKYNYVMGYYDELRYARTRRSQLGREGYSIYRVVTAEKVEVKD